ncbi:MAG: hypothetical protein GY856_45665 [bacterium]|nr:hypothetical protein [bacterium]
MELEVDLSGVESIGVTDNDDRPLIPGEKVDRYRLMTFFRRAAPEYHDHLFDRVIDPEWLASNDEEARALRQARRNRAPPWRIFHRVTAVERPALLSMGKDMRLPVGVEERPWWYASVNTIQGAVDEIQGTTDALQENVSILADSNQSIRTDLGTVTGTLDAVTGKVEGIETRLAVLETTVGNVEQSLAGLSATHETVRAELDGVKGKLDQILAALDDAVGPQIPPETISNPLSLTTGWEQYGGPFENGTVRREGNLVIVSGLIKRTTGTWGHLATLPADSRPSERLIFNLNNKGNTARVDALPDGQILWVAGGKSYGWVSLSGITFIKAAAT